MQEEALLHLSWVLACLSVGEAAELNAGGFKQLFCLEATPEPDMKAASAIARLRGPLCDPSTRTATFRRLGAGPVETLGCLRGPRGHFS